MSAELRFLDTNVLVYLFAADAPTEQAIARELVAAGRLVLSSQVLSEFYVTVTRKLTKPLDCHPGEPGRNGSVRAAGPGRHRESGAGSIRRCAAASLSYWDALIVETALEAGATTLLTEDLQHGQVISALRVHNPFLAS